jgi:UDPglucose--hexose-1-phosphate uridylyltransferase
VNFDTPHRRFNPLTGQWILVSPHRARRPWLGQVEKLPPENLPAYDPNCYLCPGNRRSTGNNNPNYGDTFVFENDFSALLMEEEGREDAGSDPSPYLFKAESEKGICRVVCFSPRHDLTLPELSHAAVEKVVKTWIDQTSELGKIPGIHYVQVFENKGAAMGCSNPHPHSQVWATGHVPNEPALELQRQEQYFQEHGSCLICDYLNEEKKRRERVVAVNDHFTAVVPFWAVWPFEILVAANRHTASLTLLKAEEIIDLADILRQVTTCYDNLFEVSFPYSMGFHQAPCNQESPASWHLHAHFYPPLLRSASVRKFMVGYEMLAMPQRDLTAETAAERLRGLPKIHYKSR